MKHARRGPVEGKHVMGVDSDPGRRPGVPMHRSPPSGGNGGIDRDNEFPDARVRAPDSEPEQQTEGQDDKLERSSLDHPTPVFGSAQPPRGISGLVRRAAYGVPEHYARHWMLLLLADRVDVVEDRLGDLMARPLENAGNYDAAARIRSNPAPVLVAGLVGFWVARKLL